MIERDVAELRARVARLEWTLEQLTKHLGVRIAPPPAPQAVSDAVIGHVRRGDKMAAIKAHMAETGADLATAKKLVDGLE
jgi:ribosomal protein L7/L12